MKKCGCTYDNISTNKIPEDKRLYQEFNDELEASYEQLKSTTELLQESEQKYKLLIDNMADMFWITDSNGIITFINGEVEHILGFKKENVLGNPVYSLMCPLHQYNNCDDIISEMRNTDFYKQKLWMLHSDGITRKVIETNTKRIYSNGVLIGVQGLGRDITEQLQLEKELRKKNRQLSALNEISSSIASIDISMNMDTLFKQISRKIVDTMGVPLCSIWLMEEDSHIYCMSCEGELSDKISSGPFKIDTPAFGAIRPDIDVYEFSNACNRYITTYGLKCLEGNYHENLLYIPFFLNNIPKGTLSICFGDSFDEDYIDLLRSISNNLALAVEKADLYEKSKQYYLKTIMSLVAAIEAKDTYTQGHSVRVSQYAVKIARELGMSKEEIEEIEIAGILHDIGKIGISDLILTKPGLLEPNEFELVKEHPAIGCRILRPIGLSENIINAALLHHKRYDLNGYPEDIHVKELPLSANIICAADAYDAMTSERSYKLPMDREEAMEELRRHSGTQFCPDVVKTMEKLYHKKLI